MMMENIKNIVKMNQNRVVKFKYYGIRNQIEEFCGTISAMYPAVFVITIDNNQIKTFSYTDLLIGNLEIVE